MTAKKNRPALRRKQQVLIVDDHPMMREGLAQLINHEADLTVCAQAGAAAEAFELVEKTSPDLALVDISLPDKSGLELIKDLHTFYPGLPMLVISMHDESLHAERALRAGARGYIMKQEGGEKLLQAIRQVLGGHIYVSHKMSARILETFSGRRARASRSPIERLTDREFEVFSLIGQGVGTREIAKRLSLSIKTIEVHRANIKQKLGLKGATELVRHAVRWVETSGAV